MNAPYACAMRVLLLGGTNVVGPAAANVLRQRHEVAVAHSGTHEHPGVGELEHFHGSRTQLLEAGGPVDRWRPDVIVDTYAGGATAEKARALLAAAGRSDARPVAISSMDVYQHCVDAGLADGTGAKLLATTPIPLSEDAELRDGPYPGGSAQHDNVAAEAALHTAEAATALRLGALYGPFAATRESYLVDMIREGRHRLELPAGGTQIWHRVALERVALAIAAACEHEPNGFWPCNVVDPTDLDFAGLAAAVGRLLDWTWEPEEVPFTTTDHPWQVRHPVLCSDQRLRDVLGVHDPSPDAALAECIEWLWRHPKRPVAGSEDRIVRG